MPVRINHLPDKAAILVNTKRFTWAQGHPMPENNDSFMDGSKGLGLAIPEEATAKLGPLPVLFGQPTNPDDPDNPDTSSCAPP